MSDLLCIPMELFSSYHDRLDTYDVILGHISLLQAVEAIVLSQICYSFSHLTGRYFICFIGHHSCDFRRNELLVEHDVRILIALLAMTLQ